MNKQWIIVIILIVLLVGLMLFAMANPNEPPTSVLTEFISEEEINNFNNIAKQCNIDVDKITRDDSLDSLDGENTLGFRIKNSNSNNIILYIKDKKIKSIRFADHYLYNDGNIISSLSDYL